MAIPSYTDIVDLIKKGATVEAQEKIMELREAVIALKEENVRQSERIRDLEDKIKIKGQIIFEGGVYWLVEEKGKDGPYCQTCYDTKEMLVRLQKKENGWVCRSCKTYFGY